MKITMLLLSMVLGTSSISYADESTNKFARCLIDALNGKERKNLAKWIFFSIAAHPEIEKFSAITKADIDKSDKFVGKLVTRLLSVDCPTELQQANAVNPNAVKKGFELVGQVAMQELMNNKKVMDSITNYAKYADQEAISKLLVK